MGTPCSPLEDTGRKIKTSVDEMFICVTVHIHFLKEKKNVSVIVTSGVRKLEPDFGGILFQGLSYFISLFPQLFSVIKTEHTNN